MQRQLSLLDRRGPGSRRVLRHRRLRHRAGADSRSRRLGAEPRPDLPHPRQRPGRKLADRRPRRRARHGGAARRPPRCVHGQARRAARRPLDGADRRGEGRRVRPDQPRGRRRQRHTANPGPRRDGDGAVPRAGWHRDDLAELRLLDGAGLAGLHRQGGREPRDAAAVRDELGVRGQERDSVGVEDRARRDECGFPERDAPMRSIGVRRGLVGETGFPPRDRAEGEGGA